MLTREEYVAVCETCAKRKFDARKGLVCSLTGEYADFDTTCPTFEIDQHAVKQVERIKKQLEEEPVGLDTYVNLSNTAPANAPRQPFSTEKKMMNSGMIGGILLIAGGFIWIIAGLSFGRLFFYPIFLIIAGIVAMVKGAAKKTKEIQKRDTSNVLDDKNDLEVL